jgi:hypothetical protein
MLKSDEEVLIYPACAAWDEGLNQWNAKITACVFEPEADCVQRAILLKFMSKAFGIEAEDAPIFNERARLFLVDHERSKEVHLSIGETSHSLGKTRPNGMVTGSVNWKTPLTDFADRIITTSVMMPFGDTRNFSGRIECIAPEGLSVITDVDDTIPAWLNCINIGPLRIMPHFIICPPVHGNSSNRWKISERTFISQSVHGPSSHTD